MLEKEGDYLVTWSLADGNFNVFTARWREACPRLCLPIPTNDIYIINPRTSTISNKGNINSLDTS